MLELVVVLARLLGRVDFGDDDDAGVRSSGSRSNTAE